MEFAYANGSGLKKEIPIRLRFITTNRSHTGLDMMPIGRGRRCQPLLGSLYANAGCLPTIFPFCLLPYSAFRQAYLQDYGTILCSYVYTPSAVSLSPFGRGATIFTKTGRLNLCRDLLGYTTKLVSPASFLIIPSVGVTVMA